MFSLMNQLRGMFGRQRPTPKIVGLLPARNEGAKIQFALRALAQHTDAIVYLDDCSTDDTLHQVEACRQPCRIERVITKDRWLRDEPADRNRLLQAGRDIGGTHFIVVDADEAITSNLLRQDILKNAILSLKRGDRISLRWIHLWRSVKQYRTDGDQGINRYKTCIFCDDGKSIYRSEFIHTNRIPKMKGRTIRLEGDFGLMHFQFVHWGNLCLKQTWYCWLEKVHHPERPAEVIINRYAGSLKETGLTTEACPISWFEFLHFDPAIFNVPDRWRHEQMTEWQREFGADYFSAFQGFVNR